MELTTKAVEVINTIANLVMTCDQIKVNASNKSAIRELRDAGLIHTGKVIQLSTTGKAFCSAMGNHNYRYSDSLSGYEYTMVAKYLMSDKEGTFYCTDEVTYKRERGSSEVLVTRVNISKQGHEFSNNEFYWKLK